MLTNKFKATVVAGIGVVVVGSLAAAQLTQQKEIKNLQDAFMIRPETVTVVVTPTPTATPSSVLRPTVRAVPTVKSTISTATGAAR